MEDINMIAVIKGEDRYVFLFDDDHAADVVQTACRFAGNPELSFTFRDASKLAISVADGTCKGKHRSRA